MNFNQKKISYNVILPNLRYKNGNVYFKSKYPIKLKINDKLIYKNEFILKDLQMDGNIDYMGTNLICNILKEELEDGLKINIEYYSNRYTSLSDMQKFARYIEACILDINMEDDLSMNDDCYENKIKNYSENLNYSSSEIEEENTESSPNYEDDVDYEDDEYLESNKYQFDKF